MEKKGKMGKFKVNEAFFKVRILKRIPQMQTKISTRFF